MKRAVKWVVIITGGAVTLALLAGWLYVKSLVPDYDGTISSPLLKNTVKIVRDRYGIPHIRAKTRYDLYFALGYAQAQDRLFQMDFYRRAAGGNLAEVLGKDLVDADRYLITMGFRRTAEEQLKTLPATTREMVEAFSDGINHFIEKGPLPLEFRLLGYRPKKWDPLDSLAMGNLLCFQLASWAYQNELLNHLVHKKLGPLKAGELLPVYSKDAVPIIGKEEPKGVEYQFSTASRDFLKRYILREFASNNWVISGRRTATGKPLLCEDSHEEGPELPTQWHMAHLVWGEMDTTGAMFPGTPIFVWGRNKRIAWGMTNFNLDNQDLYLEKIHPRDPGMVMYKGQWVKMRIIKEKIPYKDGNKTSYQEITIRITPHGPIINEIEPDAGKDPVSIKRVGAEPWPVSEAFYGVSVAKNWKEFRKALSLYAPGPQHFVYADVDGNIGYIGAGKCPVRSYSTGNLPAPGWDGRHEWRGYYPFEAMPADFNPAKGYIVTANNRPVKGKLPIPLSDYWESGSRAERITRMITSRDKNSVADMKVMHLDQKSDLAEKIVPVILTALERRGKEIDKKYIELLKNWNFVTAEESAAACLYEACSQALLEGIFRDELGAELYTRLIKDKIAVTNLLVHHLAKEKESVLFDNTVTPEKETRDEVIVKAFDIALAGLKDLIGDDPARWKWGNIHQIEFSHPFGSEKMLRPFFNYGPFPFGGDEQTVNRAGYDKTKPYKVNITASIRYIVDFADMERSLIVMSTGQSSQLKSAHRTDMTDLFLKGEYLPWKSSETQFNEKTGKTLVLIPGKK